MQIRLILLLIFALPGFIVYGQQKSFLDNVYQFIENPRMVGLNQEEGHVPIVPYTSLDKAFTFNPELSSGISAPRRKMEISVC